MVKKGKIAVLGAGSWGTTLALHLCKNKYKISLWEFFEDYARLLKKKRFNTKFLPGIKIPQDIEITSSLSEAINSAGMIVIAVPSHVVRKVCQGLRRLEIKDKIVVSCAKGIEEKTLLRMSGVIVDVLPQVMRNIVVLSGPSHAEEVARNIPTTIVAASRDEKKARLVQKVFMGPSLRVYTHTDVIGVELGGALKNIIAIAAGISDGLGYGDNSKAALMTRGMQEISRLGIRLGAKPQTFAGLSGMGDLITTCISRFSRNRNFGEMLGKGLSPEQALKKMIMVVEGIRTTRAAYQLSRRYKVEMPLTHQIYMVLFRGKQAKKAGRDLMLRPARPEMEGY